MEPGIPDESPRLDPAKVYRFFEGRSERIPELGPTRAIIYQDKNPDLAERRDATERALIVPKLALTGRERFLDIGCGTGRWVDAIAPSVSYYHGFDMTPGFIDFARIRHAGHDNCRFSLGSAEQFSLESLGERVPFDRVLCVGILMYLNDDGLESCLRSIGGALAPGGHILVREPLGQEERMTLVDHFSVELETDYHAVYRTRADVIAAIDEILGPLGVTVTDSGYVYTDAELNNRAETRQEWISATREI